MDTDKQLEIEAFAAIGEMLLLGSGEQ